MRKIKLLSLFVMLGLLANAKVYYVNSAGIPGSDGLSWATAFPSLLEAQAKVSAPAEIWVQQGTYNVVDTTLTMYSGVNVYGGFVGNETNLNARNTNAALTVLNGNKKRRVLNAASNITVETLWDGFTIQNGNSGNAGGVSLLKNATLKNCIIQNNKNSTNNGGGVYMATNATDSVKLINCVVKNNIVYYNGTSTSPNGGGGVYIFAGSFAAVVRGCTIEGNMVNGDGFTAPKMYGGGVYMCDGILENSTINGNKATNLDPGTNALKIAGTVEAGGVFVMPSASSLEITIRNCKITGNSADIKQGGGLLISPYWTSGTGTAVKVNVLNTIISNNYSYASGSGVFCDSQIATATAAYNFENCVIANNETKTGQGGVFINNKAASTVKFTNCTVVNNRMNVFNYGGAGIFYNVISSDITNCVFWGNRNAGTAPLKHHVRTKDVPGNILAYCAFDSKFVETEVTTVTNPTDLTDRVSMAQANVGTDSLYVKFVSPTTFNGTAKNATDSLSLSQANWALTATSACVDAGATVRTLTSDILGKARPFGNAYDIGAYEYDMTSALVPTTQGLSTISSVGNGIVIQNSDKLKQVKVYTLMGTLVKTVSLNDGMNTIELPAQQLYVVKAGNTVAKVMVK